MQPDPATLTRLEAAGIDWLCGNLPGYATFSRDGFVAFVERTEQGFAKPGSAGLLTESGFAALVWRGPQPLFVGKGLERQATPSEVATLRSFAADLERALQNPGE